MNKLLGAVLAAGVALPALAAGFDCPAHPLAQWLKPSTFIERR